jgi:hypothetical protein
MSKFAWRGRGKPPEISPPHHDVLVTSIIYIDKTRSVSKTLTEEMYG